MHEYGQFMTNYMVLDYLQQASASPPSKSPPQPPISAPAPEVDGTTGHELVAAALSSSSPPASPSPSIH
jgi:hypothetical protein